MVDGANTIDSELVKSVTQESSSHKSWVTPQVPIVERPNFDKIAVNDAEQLFRAKVSLAAETAYDEVGKQRGIEPDKVFFSRSCEQVSEVLERELQKNGEKVMTLEGGGLSFTPGIRGVDRHAFLAVQAPDGKVWIVDPTWQQFLDVPDETLPHVLQTPVDELEETVERYGIPRGEAQGIPWLRRIKQGIDFDNQSKQQDAQ